MRARYAGVCSKTGKRYPAGTEIEKDGSGWAIAGTVRVTPGSVGADPNLAIRRGEGYGGHPYAVGETLREEFIHICETCQGTGFQGEPPAPRVWNGKGGQEGLDAHEASEEQYDCPDCKDEPRYRKTSHIVTVLHSGSDYYREDGMSFGVGDEEGSVFWAWCRLATPEEAAPILEQEEQARQRKAARARLEAAFPRDAGEYVPIGEGFDGHLDGQTVDHPSGGHNIYGGGTEFVVESSGRYIWRVDNNGMDGDDWSRNNIRTGGAGGIGYRYPFTEERFQALQAFRPDLVDPRQPQDPEKARLQLLRDLRDRAMAAASPETRALFAADPVDCRSDAGAYWIELEYECDQRGFPTHYITVGMRPDGSRVYLKGSSRLNKDDYRALKEAGFQSSIGTDRPILHFAPTPALLDAIRSRLPAWVGTDTRGRFVVRGGALDICDNAADAVRAAAIHDVPLNLDDKERRQGVGYTPGVTVTHRDKGLCIWSDGVTVNLASLSWSWMNRAENLRDEEERNAAFRAKPESERQSWEGESHIWSSLAQREIDAGFPPLPRDPAGEPEISLTPDASALVSLALGCRSWRENNRWQELQQVDHIESREKIDSASHRTGSGSADTTLERLHCILLDGGTRVLYQVTHDWGYMGEDGDAGTDYDLYSDLVEARAGFRETAKH